MPESNAHPSPEAYASEDQTSRIRVGFNTRHGMADELAAFPPPGVEYSFPEPIQKQHRFIRSPIKCYLWRFESSEHDLLEALLTPIITRNRWICSLDSFPAAVAYNILGCPVPKSIRVRFVQNLLLQDNCKRIIFWSEAALKTLTEYGRVTHPTMLAKSTVVYPAIREVPDSQIRYSRDRVRLLFSGDFFRKGGVNVLDAFERAQQKYSHISLRICCDEQIDFNTANEDLKRDCLRRIAANDGIEFGRVPRDEMTSRLLPETDIFLLPTYNEAFGFAILEAMAFGIPVVSTNHFAIPEMIEHGKSGFLIDTAEFATDRLFRSYRVDGIPPDFREYLSEMVFKSMCNLIESPQLREDVGRAGAATVRQRFSFRSRNHTMRAIYEEAITG